MEFHDFRRKLVQSLPVGAVLRNPGGGTSTIVSHTPRNVAYRRGKSRIYVGLRDLYGAYEAFRGGTVDSSDLRAFKPQVFDSKQSGHSCNCTFLFMALKAMGIVERIDGAGRSGSPFRVKIPEGTD